MVSLAVALPPLTVDGLTEHVVLPREDDTVQVRATSEEKPDTGATLRVALPLCPLGIEREVEEVVRVKSAAAGLTVTGIGIVWLSVPLVAVMVTEPVTAEDEAVMVSVLVTAVDGLAVRGLGLKEQVRPAVPVQEKLTLPVNPCTDVTLTVSDVVLPAVTRLGSPRWRWRR